MINNILQAGTETYVDLFDGGEVECSLSATIIDNKVIYITESDGNTNEHSEFATALEEYIKICFEKKNGAKSATS